MGVLIEQAIIEAAAIAAIVGVVMEGLKSSLLPNEKVEKHLPIIAMLIGVALGIVYALVTNDDILLYAVSGLLGGGFACGFYDAINKYTGKG